MNGNRMNEYRKKTCLSCKIWSSVYIFIEVNILGNLSKKWWWRSENEVPFVWPRRSTIRSFLLIRTELIPLDKSDLKKPASLDCQERWISCSGGGSCDKVGQETLLCLVAAVCRTGPETTVEPPGGGTLTGSMLKQTTDPTYYLLFIALCFSQLNIKWKSPETAGKLQLWMWTYSFEAYASTLCYTVWPLSNCVHNLALFLGGGTDCRLSVVMALWSVSSLMCGPAPAGTNTWSSAMACTGTSRGAVIAPSVHDPAVWWTPGHTPSEERSYRTGFDGTTMLWLETGGKAAIWSDGGAPLVWSSELVSSPSTYTLWLHLETTTDYQRNCCNILKMLSVSMMMMVNTSTSSPLWVQRILGGVNWLCPSQRGGVKHPTSKWEFLLTAKPCIS